MAITKIPRNAIADNSVNASKIEDGTVAAAEISGTVGAAKLNATLDLSSKTVTLPNTSVTNGQLAGSIANAKLANSTFQILKSKAKHHPSSILYCPIVSRYHNLVFGLVPIKDH